MSENSTVATQSTSLERHTRVASLQTYLEQRAELNTRSNDVTFSQVDKILTATEQGTDDEVWNADEGGVVSGQDFVGIEFMANSWEPSPSSDQFDAPLNVFASIQATVLSQPADSPFSIGEEVVVNTGAPLIITKLRALEARAILPAACIIIAIPSRKGSVLKLRPAPEHVTSAKAE